MSYEDLERLSHLCISTNITNNMYNPSNSTNSININPGDCIPMTTTANDHPEPQLLATSVVKDSNGALIPSTSNISLLSLNHESLSLNSPKTLSNNSFILDRKNSYASQQRIQHYQKIPVATTDLSHSFPINVPPDSPNLDPISLGGSPSRFWLTNQTPPRSFNEFNKVQLLSLFSMKSKRIGSPILNPVQTQDPPMTPLYLNEENDGYFPNRIDSDDGLQMSID